ncbi:MAG: serine hydrolase [Lachnospiraceae bacterium]|nr:serine hydrolase [Lachnospiraceae bacterium]
MSQYSNLEDEIIKRKTVSNRDRNLKQRKKTRFLNLAVRVILPVMILIAAITAGIGFLIKSDKDNAKVTPNPNISIEKTFIEDDTEEKEERVPVVYSAEEGDYTSDVPSDVVSTYGILIDLDDDRIIRSRNSRVRICPASMTKILTVLVAAENIREEQLDDTMTITLEFTDYSYGNDLSAVGFAENETVTIRDLFYGTILPSGGDAAIALATYVAGSEEAFVELMNEKLKELHLSDSTHFTNVAGMYDEQHYSTVYDMAMILHAAIDNEFCREVLNAHTYTTTSTPEHPEGITISNWFLRRIEDKDCGLTVECAKTGFVVQSRNCAASFADDASGHGYICVTADSSSGWRCIYDHVSIYSSISGTSLSADSLPEEALSEDDITLD